MRGHENAHLLLIPVCTLNGMTHISHVVTRNLIILAINRTFGRAHAYKLLGLGIPRINIGIAHGLNVAGLQQCIRAIAHETMDMRSKLNRINGCIRYIHSTKLFFFWNTVKQIVR